MLAGLGKDYRRRAVYEFGSNEDTRRRALPIARKLLAEGELLLSKGLVVPVENVEVVRALAGWWRHVNALATDFLDRVEAGRTITAVPTYRSIVEHVYAMLWLAVEGEDGLTVIDFNTWNKRRIMLDELTDKATGKRRWSALEGVELGPVPDVDIRQIDDGSDRAHLKPLWEQFKKFDKLTGRFGERDMYTVYRHLCDYIHASAYTSDAYTEDRGDGTYAIRMEPKARGEGEDADLIWLPILLMQAGLVMSSRLKDDPFRRTVLRAAWEYGVPRDGLLPVDLPSVG